MNFVITAEFLKTVFNHFGPVLEISLKKTCVDPVSVITILKCITFKVLLYFFVVAIL